MRYDAEHKERTRAKVLAEAVKVIRTEGPERLGVADVMKRAGLTHGGFYAHFSSREDMLLAAMAEMFASARGVFDRIAGDLPPREGLRAYVKRYLSREHRDSQTWGCPLPYLSGDLPRLPEGARQRYAAGVERLTGVMAERLRAMGRSDAEAAAGSALAEMIGALMISRAIADPEHAQAVLDRSRNSVLARLDLGDDA